MQIIHKILLHETVCDKFLDRSEHMGIYVVCFKTGISAERGTLMPYDWSCIFRTTWSLRPYNTGRIQYNLPHQISKILCHTSTHFLRTVRTKLFLYTVTDRKYFQKTLSLLHPQTSHCSVLRQSIRERGSIRRIAEWQSYKGTLKKPAKGCVSRPVVRRKVSLIVSSSVSIATRKDV